MRRTHFIALCAGIGLAATAIASAQTDVSYKPGTRTLVLSHNAYPDKGKFTDRLDRAIASGLPMATEQDLAWVDGKSLLIHGAKNVGTNDPTLESYFFPKVKPIMERALKEGNKGNWPLITLYLDIKNDPLEHLQAISKILDKYDAWLTFAKKTNDINKVSPLELKPMMVIVEDKKDDIKQKFFYDDVPVGGKIRVFGSPTKLDENPQKLPKEKKQEALVVLPTLDPNQLIPNKADNYHRWIGIDWTFVEQNGAQTSGDWTAVSEKRLQAFIDQAHHQGYFVSFYCLDGFTETENQGWEKANNFGSKEKVALRWNSAIKAHADFISTDQMEDLSNVIKTASK